MKLFGAVRCSEAYLGEVRCTEMYEGVVRCTKVQWGEVTSQIYKNIRWFSTLRDRFNLLDPGSGEYAENSMIIALSMLVRPFRITYWSENVNLLGEMRSYNIKICYSFAFGLSKYVEHEFQNVGPM